MRESVSRGDTIDLSGNRKLGPYYVLKPDQVERIEGTDLCDLEREEWVWSVGRVLADKQFEHNGVTCLVPRDTVLASLGTDLYQCDDVECLWLR